MFTREELLKNPGYWFEGEQNELFRQVVEYMERENITRTELAKRLNVSKGYVSQILNGEFNFTVKKLIEICLAIGLVPQIKYQKLDEVLARDRQIVGCYNSNQSNIIPFSESVKVFAQAVKTFNPLKNGALIEETSRYKLQA